MNWSEIDASTVGVTEVLPAIEERSNTTVEGLGRGVNGRLTGTVITVDYATTHDSDGGVKDDPSISFSDVVEVAPEAVRATVVLGDYAYTRAVPVIGQRVERAKTDALLNHQM